MAPTIFHHWLERFHALPKARRRWIGGGLAGVAVVSIFVLGGVFGYGLGQSGGLVARVHALTTRNAALQDRLQGLRQQQKTAVTTLATLRTTMASREVELQKLKQEQAFYAKLTGLDGDRTGLGVHSVALTPVEGTSAWNFVATLVDTAKDAAVARGTLTLAVKGVRNGKLVTVGWKSLTGADDGKGLPFGFKFFQQVSGSFVLPQGFVPDHVVVTLHPRGQRAIARSMSWHEAVQGHGITLNTP